MVAWLVVLTIGLPWLGALSVLWTAEDRSRTQNQLAVSFGSLASLAALSLLPFATKSEVIQVSLGGLFGDLSFVPDGLGVVLSVIATVIGTLTIVFSADYMRGEIQLRRYYALILLFIGSMSGLVLTNSLLLLFFFWELVAFCSYALISFHNDDPEAVLGGMKALVITQIGGIGVLVGALVTVAYLGNSRIDYLLANADKVPMTALSVIAFGFLIGAAAKSAQLPFHTWLPSAMEAPTPVSALIHAATMVNAGVYLLARFYPAFVNVPGWTTAIIVIGLASALLAGCMALAATDLKRILAYSTISQLGYMVYAVGVGAIFASQLHLLSHAVFKALLFLGAGTVIHAVNTREIREMGGLGRQMPFVRNCFLLGAAALIGLPIVNGFWSKELILEASYNSQAWWLTFGLLAGVALTALYTMRVVWLVFYGEPRGEMHAHDAPAAMQVSLFMLALGTLTTWLLAGAFNQLLVDTLPYHQLNAQSLVEIVREVLTSPVTIIALLTLALGMALWWLWTRTRKAPWLMTVVCLPAYAAAHDFGFEWLNNAVIQLTRSFIALLRKTQTGQLNWNVAGIVMGLLMVLAVLLLKVGGTP